MSVLKTFFTLRNCSHLCRLNKYGAIVIITAVCCFYSFYLFSTEETKTPLQCSKSNAQLRAQTKKDISETGPTLPLQSYAISQKEIPIADFLYFVPMISPVKVRNIVSKHNTQKVRITSVTRKTKGKNVIITCRFHITGKGFCLNLFDPEEIIKRNVPDVKKGKPLENLLEYIRLDNEGYGKFVINGHKVRAGNFDSGKNNTLKKEEKVIVDEVRVDFNENNHVTPVKVALYNVKPENAEYKYKNRYNKIVAGINSLIFKRIPGRLKEKHPTMEIVLHSVENKKLTNSLWGRFKAIIANILLDPIEISCDGNMSMMAFGNAILRNKESYTFPLAIRLVKRKK